MVHCPRIGVGGRAAQVLLAVAVTILPAVIARAKQPARPAPPAAAPAAPAPAAPAPAAHPGAARSPAAPPVAADWATGLPTVDRVRAAIQGTDPGATALRQQAAFNILRQLISELSGFGAWPPAAVTRMREYDRASPNRPSMGPANPYELKLEFQREVLAKLVAPPTARAYEATSWFQDLPEMKREKAAAQKAEREKQNVQQANRQAADERSRVAAVEAVVAAAPQWIKSDVSRAQAAHVEITAFGLQFGRPLDLPTCSNDKTLERLMSSAFDPNAPRGAPTSCVGDFAGELMGGQNLLTLMARLQPLGGDAASIPGAQQVGVGVARDKCPSWLQACSVSATLSSSVLVGLTVSLGTEAKVMNQAVADLTRKYGRPSKSVPIQCTYATHSTAWANGTMISVPTGTHTVGGNALTWANTAGIYASYLPYTGTECGGRLYVELATVRASAATATARAEAADPKM